GMPVVRGIGVGLVGVALLVAIAACGPAPANAGPPASSSQTLSTVAGTPIAQQNEDVVWGRVPYCNCFATSATANVADALKQANLTVSLKELSPREGWLYFVVSFDPHTATRAQVSASMAAGGAEVIAGPP
ncbi:MAG TPA: hypothetical protein PKE45_20980, partial [Caldilineaceae bacterium]|nr:hypothetical protein [Caldilineaceae bacterium]